MASLLKRARVSGSALMRAALWACVVGGSVTLLFEPTQGLVSSLFFIAFALLLLRRYRAPSNAALPLGIALAAGGLALGSVPFDIVRVLADGLVAAAFVIVVTVLFRYATEGRNAPALDRTALRRAVTAAPAGIAPALRALLLRFDRTTWARAWKAVAVVAVLLCVAAAAGVARGQDGWRIVGGPDGAAVWNAAFLDAPLVRDGRYLRDAAIATQDGHAPRAGVADSPLLTAAKLAAPGHWPGVEIGNVLAVLDLAALLACALLFVAALSGTTGGAAVAIVAAVLVTPLLRQDAATAPFDVWPALAVATAAIRRPSPLLAVASAALGLLNVAGGYEFALLVLGLGLAGRLPARFVWTATIAGVVGSLVGALVSSALAPDATTLALYWSSNSLARLLRANGVSWPWAVGALALLVLVAAWAWSLAKRERGTRGTAAAAIVALVLAVPALLGGVPLLVPARLLDLLPLGWPTARILTLAIVLLAVPVALAGRALATRAAAVRDALRALALILLTATGCALALPSAPNVALPPIPPNGAAVELPVAESGSRASFVFADDLLERGARILQPVPYLAARTLLTGGESADSVIGLLRKQPPPAFLAIRLDVYTDPAQRFAEPTVIDAADYAIPVLGHEADARMTSLTDQARVYQLTP